MDAQVSVPFGRRVFYLAEDGFYLFDYTESQPVGDDRVDRTFLADIDSDYFHRVSAVSDPDEKRIWILYPGSWNASGLFLRNVGDIIWRRLELTVKDRSVEWNL